MSRTGKHTIIAKFPSRCAQTGKRISKGEMMVYDYDKKKCYCIDSKVGTEMHEKNMHPNSEAESTAEYINAQENAYFDQYNNSYYNF